MAISSIDPGSAVSADWGACAASVNAENNTNSNESEKRFNVSLRPRRSLAGWMRARGVYYRDAVVALASRRPGGCIGDPGDR